MDWPEVGTLVNNAVEFHDSTLTGVEQIGRDLVLCLDPAYLHRSHGQPGLDPGAVWLQALDLVLIEAVVEALPSILPCTLSEGSLSAEGSIWDNCFPLPLEVAGVVSLRLLTCHGERLAARASRVRVQPHGESRYLEPFSGGH